MQYGNAYVLKYRDNRNVVRHLRVLDPSKVKPLLSDSGDVFYELSVDHLVQVHADVVVPASEIIHDVLA